MLLAIHFMRFFYKTHRIQFSLFPNHLLPKLNGCVPAMNKIESQSPMLLCSKFVWIWPSGLDAFENVKSKQTEKRTDRWCRREYQKSLHRILFKWAKKEPNQFYWMLQVILWGDLKWLYKVNDMSSKHIENMKQLEYMYPVVQFHCCHPEFDLNEANRVHTM